MPYNRNIYNSCSQSVRIIGYFPVKLDPHIPDRVLAEIDGETVILEKNGFFSSYQEQEKSSVIKAEAVLFEGEWVVISNREMRVMPLADMDCWKNNMASKLVQEAMTIKGNPLKTLNMLESAAFLRNLDLGGFVSTLKTQRGNEDESLESVFLRVRGIRAGGKTNG